MRRLTRHSGQPDTTREEVLDALLHKDRARHDKLGRTWEIHIWKANRLLPRRRISHTILAS